MKHSTGRSIAILAALSLAGGYLFSNKAQASSTKTSNDILILRPSQLPEPAQVTGDSAFLHSDSDGDTYLYVEQQNAHRIAIFDVTDPARIKVVTLFALEAGRTFDFVCSLDDREELLRYRDNHELATLDLRKVTRPALNRIDVPVGAYELLAHNVLLAEDTLSGPSPSTRPQSYRVIDFSKPDRPIVLGTVTDVTQKISRADTGTTFFLGGGGVTVMRRLSAEEEYKTHLLYMKGNN